MQYLFNFGKITEAGFQNSDWKTKQHINGEMIVDVAEIIQKSPFAASLFGDGYPVICDCCGKAFAFSENEPEPDSEYICNGCFSETLKNGGKNE